MFRRSLPTDGKEHIMTNSNVKNGNEGKQYFYPLRDTEDPYKVSLTPVSEEIYNAVYPEIWRIQKQMQGNGQCVCPKNKLWKCDADCCLCEYQAQGNIVSLDEPVEEDDGFVTTYINLLTDPYANVEKTVIERETLRALFKEAEALNPEGRRICELMFNQYSIRDAAKSMGISSTSFMRRWEKVKEQLRENLWDLYYGEEC